MESFADVVSGNIRAVAAYRGITQTVVARHLGLTTASVAQKWHGKRPWRLEEVEAVANLFGMEPWELCTPIMQNGGQLRLAAVSDQYTARDLNPEPSD
ncbi:helix-turn-helix domain-containing protein [Trueperella pyogenes]